MAGDDAVSPVADRARQELQQPSSQPPECGSECGLSGSGCWFWLCGSGSQTRTGRAQLGGSQVPEDEDDRIRPSQQLFVAKPIVNDHIHSIEILSIHPVPRQNPPGQHTLQRGKSEEPIRIAPQNELHQPVAEAANAVIKKDGVRHGFGPAKDCSSYAIRRRTEEPGGQDAGHDIAPLRCRSFVESFCKNAKSGASGSTNLVQFSPTTCPCRRRVCPYACFVRFCCFSWSRLPASAPAFNSESTRPSTNTSKRSLRCLQPLGWTFERHGFTRSTRTRTNCRF